MFLVLDTLIKCIKSKKIRKIPNNLKQNWNQKTDNFTNILEEENQIILKSFGARKTNDFKIFLSKKT
jgi:hypothetical protein